MDGSQREGANIILEINQEIAGRPLTTAVLVLYSDGFEMEYSDNFDIEKCMTFDLVGAELSTECDDISFLEL